MTSPITAQDIQALKGKMDYLAQFILDTQQRRDERHPNESDRRNELDDYILDLKAKHSQAEAEFIVTVTQHSVRGYTVTAAPVKTEGAHAADVAVAAVATASAGRKRARVDTTVDELALLAQGNSKGYIIVTALGQVIHADGGVDDFLKQNGNVGSLVFDVDRCRLHDAWELFANFHTHSISHRPKQTQMTVASAHGHYHGLMDGLITAVGKLQEAATDIGEAALAMMHGTLTPKLVGQLVTALRKTFDEPQLRGIYATPMEASAIDAVLGRLQDDQHSVSMDMIVRILHSAEVLSRYTCLVTSVTSALASRFGRGQGDSEMRRPAISDYNLRNIFKLHTDLNTAYATNASAQAVQAHAPASDLRYDPNSGVYQALVDMNIIKKLKDMSKALNDTGSVLGHVAPNRASG
ncbi:hypothetical protein PG996_006113 [Apiospora saccharicola]|uniref:Uncharacterized protein n=1 Tax=Apiospora saccharicola TaxID=335842 RepID=A0ABR1VNF2_9PEZI